MEALAVLVTNEAIFDMADIADWIELNFGYNRSQRFRNEIEDKINALSTGFGLYSDTDIVYRGYSIKKMVFGPSIVFFVVNNGNGIVIQPGVHVLRVLRHERNWQEILRDQQIYTYPL